MAGNTQFAGRVFVNIDGVRLRSKSGAKLNIGGVERTPVETDLGTVGYTEKTKTPTVECTIILARDTDLVALGALADVTLVFETDIGVSYVLKDAFVTEPPEFTGGEGEVSLKFAGTRCDKV
ncbi:Mu-like prophage FluMu tail tube protein [Chitiniphilus shinanonensis]|uniref:Mu-like prophage FluMu tail tube protein n=1 Tax=Chitiniphilus shinanonensis TaxID=553088 RepID=A0ABQ6BQN7_9NEIS|nr:phage tail tube protein [Chitiniphilus shinanonensis]GLS03769.1 Mu-like prophage FluMu tail tube protein [Chitiniphilus shinanonensis]